MHILTCSFLMISVVTGQHIGAHLHTMYTGTCECTGGIVGAVEIRSVLCCSLVRLTWPVGSAWAIFVFFWSELAAGRRGWNTVRPAEWSSEGGPHANREDFLEATFWKVKALTELHLL